MLFLIQHTTTNYANSCRENSRTSFLMHVLTRTVNSLRGCGVLLGNAVTLFPVQEQYSLTLLIVRATGVHATLWAVAEVRLQGTKSEASWSTNEQSPAENVVVQQHPRAREMRAERFELSLG